MVSSPGYEPDLGLKKLLPKLMLRVSHQAAGCGELVGAGQGTLECGVKTKRVTGRQRRNPTGSKSLVAGYTRKLRMSCTEKLD